MYVCAANEKANEINWRDEEEVELRSGGEANSSDSSTLISMQVTARYRNGLRITKMEAN